jgi:hypothetical protein
MTFLHRGFELRLPESLEDNASSTLSSELTGDQGKL